MQCKKTEASNELAAERHTAVYAHVAAVQPGYSSLEAQVEVCVRQAAEDGAPPVGAACVFRDQGSGRELDRPGLNQLRRAVQAGEVGVLYVYSRSRLSRHRIRFALLYQEFVSAGVEIRFVQDAIDNHRRGRLSGSVSSGVSGYAHDKGGDDNDA